MILNPSSKFPLISTLELHLDDVELTGCGVITGPKADHLAFLPLKSRKNKLLTYLVIVFGEIDLIPIQSLLF